MAMRQAERYRSLALLGSSYTSVQMRRGGVSRNRDGRHQPHLQERPGWRFTDQREAAMAMCQAGRYRSLALLGSSYTSVQMRRGGVSRNRDGRHQSHLQERPGWRSTEQREAAMASDQSTSRVVYCTNSAVMAAAADQTSP
jgi:hypothetical protein